MLKFGIESHRRIFYAGESVKFFLCSDEALPDGSGYLRTNLGMAAIRRREIIDQVEKKSAASRQRLAGYIAALGQRQAF